MDYTQFAAGIIPYKINRGFYFLLGFERNKWSGFVGNSEIGESPTETAFREFNEETAMVFEKLKDYIKFELETKEPIIEKTQSGKLVYLWFIDFTNEHNNFSQFHINQQIINKREYFEKDEIGWFSLNEIETNRKILYRLKKTIIKYFKFIKNGRNFT